MALIRRLRALDYALWEKFVATDVKHARTLVVWLEETKIRFLPIADRVGLRDIENAMWGLVFDQYLTALECPAPRGALEPTLLWLSGRAVALEYKDNQVRICILRVLLRFALFLLFV
jgi:hypothetical protein